MSQPFTDEQLRRIEQVQHLRSLYRWAPSPAPQQPPREPAQPTAPKGSDA